MSKSSEESDALLGAEVPQPHDGQRRRFTALGLTALCLGGLGIAGFSRPGHQLLAARPMSDLASTSPLGNIKALVSSDDSSTICVDTSAVALSGYDVVAYFSLSDGDAAVKGSDAYTATFKVCRAFTNTHTRREKERGWVRESIVRILSTPGTMLAHYVSIPPYLLSDFPEGMRSDFLPSPSPLCVQEYTYNFVSEANRDLFLKSPSSYVPQYGGFCAYGISSESWCCVHTKGPTSLLPSRT